MTRPTALLSARPTTHRFARRWLASAALATLATAAIAGCASSPADPPDAATGQIVVPLIQAGAHGELYHLNNAIFDITGSVNGFSQTIDASGFDPEVDVAMPPGLFSIQLQDGWTLEQSLDGGATFQPVSALLGSSNPQQLRVLAGQPLTVEYDFVVRSTTGTTKVRIGVAAEPRELAGGFVISSATDGLAAYATTNPNLDFAVFFEPLSIQRVVLPDGTKQLVYAAGAVGASGPTPPPFTAVAMEFYNDRLGILSGPIASGMSGAALDYTVAATTDGLVTLQGTIDGDSASIAFGVNAIDAVLPTLDADGFPSDEFFYDSSLPYSLSSAQGTLSGVMRLRQLLPQ